MSFTFDHVDARDQLWGRGVLPGGRHNSDEPPKRRLQAKLPAPQSGWVSNLVTIAALLLAGGLTAQTQDTGLSIRTSVREVVVDVEVHDKNGKLVKNVDPSSVTLYEDGARQEILSWRLVGGPEVRKEDAQAPSTDVRAKAPARAISPLRTVNLVCLVFHDVGPQTRKQAFEAARDFLATEARPNTIIGVFRLDDAGVHPFARFTTDQAALQKAIVQAASGTPSLDSSQAMFNAMGMQRELTLTPAGVTNGPANLSSSASFGTTISQMDADTATGEAADVARNPLGRQGIHEERVVALREMNALQWLVSQLAPMPFRKTVLLLSPGISRPAAEIEYWRSLLKSASAAKVSFYALELNGIEHQSPEAASKAGAGRATSVSQQQTAPTSPYGNGLSQMADRSQEFEVSDYAVASADTHLNLVDLTEGTGGFLITDSSKKALGKIMDDAQTHFELTYRPATETYDGRFHKIEVKLAKADLRVEARSGYYAVPEEAGAGLTPVDMAGFRALNTTPALHAFDYRAAALRFQDASGKPGLAVAMDIPIANLGRSAAVADANGKHGVHVSLLAVIKDANRQIVNRFSSDSPMEVTDADLKSGKVGHVMFEKPVTLDPGHYTLETAAVDWVAGNASTSVAEFDCVAREGPQISSVILVRSVEAAQSPAADDPLVYQGKRIVPALFTALNADAKPSVFFRVYPDRKSSSKPRLRAQFVLDGKVIADQVAELGEVDGSGSIPVLVQAAAKPGNHELRLTVMQGDGSARGEIRYTVAAKQ
jgi:VWFA-related protein